MLESGPQSSQQLSQKKSSSQISQNATTSHCSVAQVWAMLATLAASAQDGITESPPMWVFRVARLSVVLIPVF